MTDLEKLEAAEKILGKPIDTTNLVDTLLPLHARSHINTDTLGKSLTKDGFVATSIEEENK